MMGNRSFHVRLPGNNDNDWFDTDNVTLVSWRLMSVVATADAAVVAMGRSFDVLSWFV